jgi:glycosyltransferase involved in cell wall biosynthesis
VSRKIVYVISDIDKALAFEWIVANLNKNKFELSFILIIQHPAQLAVYLKNKGIPCYLFFYRRKKNLIKITLQLIKLLSKLKPDIVHCHLIYASLVGLTSAWITRVPNRFYTRHHSDYHHRYFPKGIKWDKLCNKLATRIIAPSGAVQEVLVEYEQVPEKKICLIHHGFDLNYFTEVNDEQIVALRNKYQVNNSFPVIGVISRFTELKGIQYIIPAFHRLLQKHPNALLLLFNARGDNEKQIKQQLQQMIPQKSYRLIPFENDLAAVYRLLDFFVQVSTDRTIEAFGQTYVEALAAGVPSVFTLSGIANDFIRDRENALVVPFKDSDAIYTALKELLTNHPLCETIIYKGRESVAKKFSIDTMILKLEALYEEN